jgi:hypothetical protein
MKIVPMHKQRNKKYLAGQASLFAVGRQYAARPKRMKKRKDADDARYTPALPEHTSINSSVY